SFTRLGVFGSVAQKKAATRSSAKGMRPLTRLSLRQKLRFTPSSSRSASRIASISALVKGFVKASLMHAAPLKKRPFPPGAGSLKTTRHDRKDKTHEARRI